MLSCMNLNRDTAVRIRALLAAKGETQAAMSLATGLSLNTLGRRLAGTSSWTLDEVSRVADFLHTDPAVLLGYQQSPALGGVA